VTRITSTGAADLYKNGHRNPRSLNSRTSAMTRIGIGAALIAVSLLSVTAAKAETDTMVVHMGDLNVTSSQGAEVALRRIKNAAMLFCGDYDKITFTRRIEHQRCEMQMTDQAVSSLNAPTVTALYKGRSSIQLANRDAH
jgi:UrcA family protein